MIRLPVKYSSLRLLLGIFSMQILDQIHLAWTCSLRTHIYIYSCTVHQDSSEYISKLLLGCNEMYLRCSIWITDIMVYYELVLENGDYIFIYHCVFDNHVIRLHNMIREIRKYFELTHGVHWTYIHITTNSSRMLTFHGIYPNMKFYLKQNIHCRDLSKLTWLQMIS